MTADFSPALVGETEHKTTHLNRGLDRLHLYTCRLVQTVGLHISEFARLPVDPPRVLATRMFGLPNIRYGKMSNDGIGTMIDKRQVGMAREAGYAFLIDCLLAQTECGCRGATHTLSAISKTFGDAVSTQQPPCYSVPSSRVPSNFDNYEAQDGHARQGWIHVGLLFDKRTRNSVSTRIAFPPAFCTSVRGMTSRASATARYGQLSIPCIVFPFFCKLTEIAISVAPPPGDKNGLNTTLRATDMASARLRSISFRTSLDGPLSRIVHAFGAIHFVRNAKYLP